MKKPIVESRQPEDREQTVRQSMVALLTASACSIGGLSRQVKRQEKEIYHHLTHIQRSHRLRMEAAECLSCGFRFKDRVALKKPSKCPQCRSTYIEEPLYFIE